MLEQADTGPIPVTPRNVLLALLAWAAFIYCMGNLCGLL